VLPLGACRNAPLYRVVPCKMMRRGKIVKCSGFTVASQILAVELRPSLHWRIKTRHRRASSGSGRGYVSPGHAFKGNFSNVASL
jgi:hypothetical protein